MYVSNLKWIMSCTFSQDVIGRNMIRQAFPGLEVYHDHHLHDKQEMANLNNQHDWASNSMIVCIQMGYH